MGSTDEELAQLREFSRAKAEVNARPADAEYWDAFISSTVPRHAIEITSPFYLATTEVTVGQFRQYLEAHPERTPPPAPNGINFANTGYEQTDQHPINRISIDAFLAFAQWLSEAEGESYRFPTEAEWEYAARGGSNTLWHFGGWEQREQLPQYAVVESGPPQPVAGRRPNPFGLFDVYGNMWEFCQDSFDAEFYSVSPLTDPVAIVPGDRGEVVVRGNTRTTSFFMINSVFRWKIKTGDRGDFNVRLLREIRSPSGTAAGR